MVGAFAIRRSGANWLDPLLGIVIGLMVLWSGSGILRESGHILLEGLPRESHLERVARALLGVDGVQEVHDMHIWTLGTNLHALSCHIRIPDMRDGRLRKNSRADSPGPGAGFQYHAHHDSI